MTSYISSPSNTNIGLNDYYNQKVINLPFDYVPTKADTDALNRAIDWFKHTDHIMKNTEDPDQPCFPFSVADVADWAIFIDGTPGLNNLEYLCHEVNRAFGLWLMEIKDQVDAMYILRFQIDELERQIALIEKFPHLA